MSTRLKPRAPGALCPSSNKRLCGHGKECKTASCSDDLPWRTGPSAKGLLHPPSEDKRKHKKCLVQSPSSYFLDVRCPGCYKITMCSDTCKVVLCVGCSTVLCQPTEDRQGSQKDTPSDGSSTESTLNRHEWETIPINRFWRKKRKKECKAISPQKKIS